jgi:glutathione S-transferase
MLIYHVARASDWDAARSTGSYRVSTLGRTLDDEGFIHCSYADQVAGVANILYAGVAESLVLLAVDTDRVGSEVIAENTGGGIELFPHVYGPIPVAAVATVTELTRDADDRIVVPALPPAPAASPE